MDKKKVKQMIKQLDNTIADLEALRDQLKLSLHPMLPAEELLARPERNSNGSRLVVPVIPEAVCNLAVLRFDNHICIHLRA